MKNIKCILEVYQGSILEQEINDSCLISESYMIWEDTGLPVKYPINYYTLRKRKCIERVYHELYFNAIAKKYIDKIKFVSENENPPWGHSWWTADHMGLIKLYKSNWDSSD